MQQPVILDESISVARPVGEAFSYVADFARIREWDPGVAWAEKLSVGPTAVGSQFRVDMKAGFSLLYTVQAMETNHRLLMTVTSRWFTAREEIIFASNGADGCTVRYIAQFEFVKVLRIANTLYPALMQRVADDTMKGMQAALEDNFVAPEPSPLVALADRLVLPGIWRFTSMGYRFARKQWQPMSAHLGGRNVVITGATSGVGLAAAEALAAMGARLTLVVRNLEKAQDVLSQLQRSTGNTEIRLERCDMSLMADVHALADKLLAKGEPIDCLINNAGALFNPRQLTSEGLESSFALLLLGPYILTERLQPLLASAATGRVINVLSGGMYSQKLELDDLQSQKGSYSGSVAYARAKRGLMILTEEWARRWADDGIVVNAMHPGWADTPGVETALPAFYKLTRKVLRSPEQGADTIVWLAAATEAAAVSGKFWLDRQQHPTHITSKTQESAAERDGFLAALAVMKEPMVYCGAA